MSNAVFWSDPTVNILCPGMKHSNKYYKHTNHTKIRPQDHHFLPMECYKKGYRYSHHLEWLTINCAFLSVSVQKAIVPQYHSWIIEGSSGRKSQSGANLILEPNPLTGYFYVTHWHSQLEVNLWILQWFRYWLYTARFTTNPECRLSTITTRYSMYRLF